MSKDSSIKVFAENVGDTNPRPVNNIPVWIENVSAIGGGGGGGDIPSDVSGKWEDASDCVQTNSATWGQGGGDNNMFYIYPGITTQQEVSENSGKNMKLYMSATNTYLDYAGKYTYSTGTSYCFRSISGAPRDLTYVNQVGITVKPGSAGVVLPFYTQKDTLVTNGGTVENAVLAQTAYYDANNNSLTDTYYSIQNLSTFVQNNSANWGGGSGPTGNSGKVLFNKYHSYDPYGSTVDCNYVSGASDLYFTCSVNEYSQPQEITIYNHGGEVASMYWSQVSSDGTEIIYSGCVRGLPTNEKLMIVTNNSYTYCYVSANGCEINLPFFDSVMCTTSTNVNFNVQGYYITGVIESHDQGGHFPLTSFNGQLTGFSAVGYEYYKWYVNYDNTNNSWNYDLSAEFGGTGGSSVTSGDVLPPAPTGTGNTYALYWNDSNGLFWDVR